MAKISPSRPASWGLQRIFGHAALIAQGIPDWTQGAPLAKFTAVIRLFAAIEIPPEIAATLARRQQGLPGARWRSEESLHVTLRFFGEVGEETAGEIDEGLGAIRQSPFDLELRGAGAFGEGADVRAVWAGVEGSESLDLLHGRCESVARRVGLKAEGRTWRPHVTLAYLRRPEPARVAAWIGNHNLLHSPPFQVGWFGLYSSWLSKDGSRYELEREYPLVP